MLKLTILTSSIQSLDWNSTNSSPMRLQNLDRNSWRVKLVYPERKDTSQIECKREINRIRWKKSSRDYRICSTDWRVFGSSGEAKEKLGMRKDGMVGNRPVCREWNAWERVSWGLGYRGYRRPHVITAESKNHVAVAFCIFTSSFSLISFDALKNINLFQTFLQQEHIQKQDWSFGVKFPWRCYEYLSWIG